MRAINRLSIREIAKARKGALPPGKYHDGAGLYLQIGPTGTAAWIFRYMLDRRSRDMGLGSLSILDAAKARKARDEQRELLLRRVDPIEARDQSYQQDRLERSRSMTFRQCAEAYIEAHRAAWSNAKSAPQWRSSLKTYSYPIFGSLPVQAVDTALVMKALAPIWTEKTDTATKVRGRIEVILGWATTQGYRQGDNPARWKGHLANLLAQPSKVAPVQHQPALPFAEIAEFITELRSIEGVAADCLAFTILTASRTSEAIGARWSEIDLERKLWVVPPDRIKSRREHRQPLSAPALAILASRRKKKRSDFVFEGRKAGKPLSNMAMLKLLARMGRDDITTHGFRSSFKDWAAEMTTFPNEVSEMALAHVVSDATERAYRRGDLYAKRAGLMDEWAAWCGTKRKGATVTDLSKARKAKASK
jgi:integrase